MKVPVQCACGRSYMVALGSRPKNGRCAACGGSIAIPARPSPAAPAAPAAAPPRGRPWRTILLLLLIPIASGILLGTGGYAWFASRARAELEAELEAIRAAGEPVDLAEVVPPAVRASENAAPLYRQAVEALVEEEPDWTVLEAYGASRFEEPSLLVPEEEARRRIGLWLEANRTALDLARAAARRPRCNFDLDWSRGFEMELPHLSGLKDLATVLSLEALFRARGGDVAGALESLGSAFACGDALEEERILISHLVRRAIHGIALAALRTIVEEGLFPPEETGEWTAYLAGRIGPEPLARALAGERCLTIANVDDLYENPEKYGAGEVDLALPRLLQLHRRDLACYLRFMREAIAIWRRGYPGTEAERADFGRRSDDLEPGFVLTAMLLPAHLFVMWSEVSFQANVELARAALEIASHRSTAGWPPRLEGNPTDPATGKPLAYRVEADVATVDLDRPEDPDDHVRPEPWRIRASRLLGDQEHAIRAVAFAGEGRWIAAAGEDGVVRVREAVTGRILREVRSGIDPVTGLFPTSVGCIVGGERSMEVWDLEAARLAIRADLPHGVVLRSALRPGTGLPSEPLESVGAVRLHRLEPLPGLRVVATESEAFAFSGDGRRVLAGGSDRRLHVWDVETRRRILDLAGHGAAIRAIAASPDGRWYASGDDEGAVLLWDAREGRLAARFVAAGRRPSIASLAFHPGGTSLAVAAGQPWIEVFGLPRP